MKKMLLIATTLMGGVFANNPIQAQTTGYDFQSVSPSGHTLYYHVVDQTNHWVELTHPNGTDGIWGEAWENYSTPYGNVVVPQTVTYSGNTWTVKRIGRSAFASCSTVSRLTLPDGIDSIKAYAFFGTEIDSVNIPGSVVYIGSSNFHNSQLRYINLPASLEYIDPWENDGPGVLACSVEEGNPYYRTINGCLVRHVNDLVTLITYPRGSIVDSLIVIPEGITRVDEYPMEQIMWESRRIVFPSTITYIHLPWFSHDTIEIHNPLPPAYGDWCNHDFQDNITLLVPCGTMQRYNATAWTIVGDVMATIDNPIQEDYAQTINYGESYTWGSLTLTERGVYEDTLQSVVEGCDSVHRVLTLNVVQPYRSDVLLTAANPAVAFHGLVVDRPGIYDVLVPGEGNFDSLFVLRASAQLNATLSTAEMGGVFAGQTFELPAAQSRQFVRGEDTVTITNIHQLLYDTVNVTIAEGDSYRGHTQAGVYQDTILGTDADSIIRSRISMIVNRPLDNCTVQLFASQPSQWTNLTTGDIVRAAESAITIPPAESHVLINYMSGYNLLENGDFEQGETGFISQYTHTDCGGSGCGYNTINVCFGCGVDGSMGLGLDGAVTEMVLYEKTIPNAANGIYRFSYMATATTSENPPYFAVIVNGVQMGDIDYTPQGGEWISFEHIFNFDGGDLVLQVFDRCLEGAGNDFYMDNFSLECLPLTNGNVDTVTVTNTHILVRDTVDVTIAEGENYRNHTLAGIYQDTILGTDADSIVRSRISYLLNASGKGTTTLTSNTGETIVDLDNGTIYTGDSIAVLPMQTRHFGILTEGQDTNMVVNGDFEQGNTGFSSYYMHRPLPYSLEDETMYIGGYRIDQFKGNNYFHALYNHCNNGPAYCDTVSVEPNTWYVLSYKAVANVCYSDQGNMGPLFHVDINGNEISTERFHCTNYGDFYATNGCSDVNQVEKHSHLVYSNDSTMSIALRHANEDYWGWYIFAYDDISLTPLTISETITITNTHGLIYDTLNVTIAEGENYRNHTLAGVYQDTILGSETDSIVYARVSMDINYSYGNGTVCVATDQEGRMWMGLDDDVLTTEAVFSAARLNPTEERRYVLTSVADGSNLQPNGDFEQEWSNCSSDYAGSDIPFQGSHYITICDTCGRTGKGIAAKGSQLTNKYVYSGEWVNLVEGHRYSFSYWAKSHSGNPAQLAVDLYDQQNTYRIADTADLGEAMDGWKRFEHVFTAYRTYASLLRITDLNTSSDGNEFFIDDVSIIELTEDTNAQRDTIKVRNIHQLVYNTVDTTINEGENYNGHTVAGVYNDTVGLADYDSIVRSRISYVLNASGKGTALLGSNTDGQWLDLDDNTIYSSESVSVAAMQTRHFARLVPAADTNLIVNGDFEQGNTGFTSHFLYRPEPYNLGDDTYYIGGYRINQKNHNHYFYAFNYWEPRQGAPYEVTVNVVPDMWYALSYRGVSNHNSNSGGIAVVPRNVLVVNGQYLAADSLPYDGNVDINVAGTCSHAFYNGSDSTITLSLSSPSYAAWTYYGWEYYDGVYDFAYDDITLVPLKVADTVTITNRHQIVYATVDTTINEGESYNGYTLAGVYVDTVYFTDYDSITTSRISMVINSLDGEVSLSSNNLGWWKDINDSVFAQSPTFTTQVLPMQSSQFVFDGQLAAGNILVNGNFEQGTVGFSSQYNYYDGCRSCGPNNYAVLSGFGVDGSSCLSFDGSETYGTVLYEQTVQAISGTTYQLNYMATTNGQDNSNPAYFEVLVNGVAIGSWDYITSEYPVWNTFEHTFVAGSGTLTLQIIDRNTEGSGNDCLIDEIELTAIGGTNLANDTITITNRHQLVYDTTRVDICQGATYTNDSTQYEQAGTYNLNTRFYEDSTVYPTLVLGVHNNYHPQLVQAICEGESYAFGGNTLTTTGIYADSLTTVWGCDSTITLDLTVHAHTASLQTEDVCDSYSWHGSVYTASTIVADTIANTHGCDSICTLNLTVRHSTTGDTLATACDVFLWYDQTYTASGMPTHVLTNSVGCDSTLTLALTVNYSTSGSETFTVCDSMTWHENLYTASGTYQDVLTNGVGCDSTVSLHLTVNSTYHHTDAVFACDNHMPYTYQGTDLAEAGEHQVVLQSTEGCDSTITVTLTVGATYRHDDQLTLCQSGMPYTYGVQTFEADDESGVYEVPFSSIEGCDSLIDLNLTIHESEATEIYMVTVNGIYNMVVWEHQANVEYYNIYRESSTAGIYTLMAEVPFDDVNMWIDSTSDNRARSYRYRISSTDSCGVESELSEIHKTMHLTISQGINNSWNLVWTEYEGTIYTTYHIYRGTSYNSLSMIDEMPAGGNTTYTDYNAPEGEVYYQIVILMSPDGTKDVMPSTINSNIATNAEVGIGSVTGEAFRVYVNQGAIVAEAPRGVRLRLFDAVGREISTCSSTGHDIFQVPVSGNYMIHANGLGTCRVMVVK